MNKLKVLPSLLSANFNNLEKDMNNLKKIGIESVHYDVMDGHFVPNLSFGTKILKEIKSEHPKILYDTHLMISNPDKYLQEYIDAGSNAITWHIEIDIDHNKLIDICKTNNILSGLSIKPKTSINDIKDYLSKVDIILVMSVEPGFGGQSFIESSLEKISNLKKIISDNNYSTKIYVDGGVNNITAKKCKEHGADVVITGSYLFGAKDMKKALEDIHE